MASFDTSPRPNNSTAYDTPPLEAPEQAIPDVVPPVGITPPQVLAQDAAAGRRGAAWRLMHWIMENDPRAVVAVSSLKDDRLARNLLEFIALGTWAGKPFVVPVPLRSPYARTRLRTLFSPGSGMDPALTEPMLLAALHDNRPAVRETAIQLLGIIGSRAAIPELVTALNDPNPSMRMQAAKALGRVGDSSAVPPLLNALRGADEQLGSQIFASLVRLGHHAVPSLIEASASNSAWMRWHAVRALGEIRDSRALPVLVRALGDPDHSVAWMAAKKVVLFSRRCVAPVLTLLTSAAMTPWLVETASYVLQNQCQHHTSLKPYLEPVIQQMHQSAYRVATTHAAQKALAQLKAESLLPVD